MAWWIQVDSQRQHTIRMLQMEVYAVWHFQRPGSLAETIERLEDGTEVMAGGFFITGKDDAEHDANLQAFLNRCHERNLVLNMEKVRFKLHEVSFMGCLLTDEGMKSDPRKVKAVLDMPMPTDVERVSLDATYKLTELRMPLYVIVAIDGNGHSEINAI